MVIPRFSLSAATRLRNTFVETEKNDETRHAFDNDPLFQRGNCFLTAKKRVLELVVAVYRKSHSSASTATFA
jgi:hypothetical protein